MRRRFTTTLGSTVLVLMLLGCDPETKHQSAPSPVPTPTGNLCERVQPKLTGTWIVGPPEPELYAPLSDSCLLTDAAQKTHQIQLSLSAIPITDQQRAVLRKSDAGSVAGWYAAKVTDGGVGVGSWALNPVAAAPWLVVHAGDRLVRLTVMNEGPGTLAELQEIARKITGLPGLPAASSMIARPECGRGRAAAERVLGSKVVVERDALAGGYLSCQWGTATGSVAVRSAGPGSGLAIDFSKAKAGVAAGWAHRVKVGAEGWQESIGVLFFRSISGTYVEVTGTPGSVVRPGPILALAQAIAPAYS